MRVRRSGFAVAGLKKGVLVFSIIPGLLLSSACRTLSVHGELSYDGMKADKITAVEPGFRITNRDSAKRVNPEIQYHGGRYKIFNLPEGNYTIEVSLDAEEPNPFNYPGDLVARVELYNGPEDRPEDIELARIIHLTAPQDNSTKLPMWGVECNLESPAITSPVHFTWEPLGKGVEYLFEVNRKIMDPNDPGEQIAKGATLENNITLSLPPSAKREYYLFHMTAKKGGRVIGLLMTQNLCYIDVNYHFRVAGPQ